MKMVKKCLIAIAVVALLATTVQAAAPNEQVKHDGTWPWTKTYEAIDLCDVKVTLEVGHFAQIEKCGDLKIALKQVNCTDIGKGSGDFPCYGDGVDGPQCITVKARANFVATFGCRFISSDLQIITDNSVYFDGEDTIPGDGEWFNLKLCMKAWKVKLWDSDATSGTPKVGTIMITVKPQTETGGSW